MEVGSRRRAESREREVSPERTKVWTEPRPRPADRKVPVVYYLSRNGHLEHPHFMEVSIPSGEGLYLRDVTKRLNSLRGKGMASIYAWSAKRSYKNGFVWHDLSEDDFIYPARGDEYVLKGSELPHLDSDEPEEAPVSVRDDSDISVRRRERASWGSFDLNEYKVYKSNGRKSADVCTQTEDRSRNRRPRAIKEEEEQEENVVTELGRDEVSPPCSTSSSETLEGLIKADGRIVPVTASDKDEKLGGSSHGRKMKGPAALMQLLSCGSVSVKRRGFSLVSHFKERLPRVRLEDVVKGSASFSSAEMEDKEYFSGSLIELKKRAEGVGGNSPAFRRSSSCNAERGLKMELAEEIEGVRARCIPRKLKAATRKKEENLITTCSSADGCEVTGNEP